MLKKSGRLVCINGTDVTITGMDYDYPIDIHHHAQSKFNITFNVAVANKDFVINFSNERLSSQQQYLADTFVGTGSAYNAFLNEVESKAKFRDKNAYSDETKNAANAIIGAIAQSVYSHVQSHSPDQDEE